MGKVNAYNTTDPAALLQLKRQESALMLEIVRSMNPNLTMDDVLAIVIPKVIKQLDVNRLLFITNFEEKKRIEVTHNFPFISPADLVGLDTIIKTQPVDAHNLPALAAIGVEYAIPLGRRQQETPAGWFLIADFAESEDETQNDLVFIETVGNILALSLENIRLIDEKVSASLLQQELEVASKIQKQSLPSSFEISPTLDIYAEYIAHYMVAGDFYDLIPIGEDELFFCMADVSGKGIASAILVANLQASLRALIQASASFHQIVKQLHFAIARLTRREQFVTIFLARLNVKTLKMAYVNAGHNPQFVVRNGKIKTLDKGCIPLGMLPIENIDIGYERLQAGDLLFLYTDGLVEQVNSYDEMIGTARITEYLAENSGADAKEIVEQTLAIVERFAARVSSTDDMSLMAIKVLK